jgi:hypothetical protein
MEALGDDVGEQKMLKKYCFLGLDIPRRQPWA